MRLHFLVAGGAHGGLMPSDGERDTLVRWSRRAKSSQATSGRHLVNVAGRIAPTRPRAHHPPVAPAAPATRMATAVHRRAGTTRLTVHSRQSHSPSVENTPMANRQPRRAYPATPTG
jgi:hypothetical protein